MGKIYPSCDPLRTYKHSGINWLNELAEFWVTCSYMSVHFVALLVSLVCYIHIFVLIGAYRVGPHLK